jgi:hypothetical protein
MYWTRNEMMGFVMSCSCLIVISAGTCQALEKHAIKSSPQEPSSAALTKADHTILKKRIIIMRSSTDELENRLDVLMKMPHSNREQAWEAVHESIARLKTDSMNISDHTSTLKKRNLVKSDWAALHLSAGNGFNDLQMKLEALIRRYDVLLKSEDQQQLQKKEDQMKEDIKSKRSEVESKFKAGEQARNSDYNILISIVKMINEERGIFDKAMM